MSCKVLVYGGVLLLGATAKAEQTWLKCEQVPRSTHIEGSLTLESGAMVHIRSDSTRFLVPPVKAFILHAYRGYRMLKNQIPCSLEPQVKEVEGELVFEAKEEDSLLVLAEEDPPGTPEEEVDLNKNPGRTLIGALLTVGVGVGPETISSSGGGSQWDTDSYVGGSQFSLTDRTAFYPEDSSSSWVWQLGARAHNLSLKIKNIDADGAESTEEESFFRADLFFRSLWPQYEAEHDPRGLGYLLGVRVIRYPVLAKFDLSASSAKPLDRYLMGPTVGVFYRWLQEGADRAQLLAEVLPYGLGETTGYFYYLEAEQLWNLIPSFWLSLKGEFEGARGTTKPQCSGVGVCADQVSFDSQLYRVWLGLVRDL